MAARSTPASRWATFNSQPVSPNRERPPSTTGAARTSTATPPTPRLRSSPAVTPAQMSSCRSRSHPEHRPPAFGRRLLAQWALRDVRGCGPLDVPIIRISRYPYEPGDVALRAGSSAPPPSTWSGGSWMSPPKRPEGATGFPSTRTGCPGSGNQARTNRRRTGDAVAAITANRRHGETVGGYRSKLYAQATMSPVTGRRRARRRAAGRGRWRSGGCRRGRRTRRSGAASGGRALVVVPLACADSGMFIAMVVSPGVRGPPAWIRPPTPEARVNVRADSPGPSRHD